jgi:hypothetical protein
VFWLATPAPWFWTDVLTAGESGEESMVHGIDPQDNIIR